MITWDKEAAAAKAARGMSPAHHGDTEFRVRAAL